MKLDRNDEHGRAKYGVILNRRLTFDDNGEIPIEVSLALRVLDQAGLLAEGGCGLPEENFVLMLKDRFAKDALQAYADAARRMGMGEYACEIEDLAERAGPGSPYCKTPD